jgi:hypothetical protein
MEFEIDISGNDLLSKNYTICVANKDSLIKGFKFDDKLVRNLCSRYGQGIYKYSKSKKGKSLFKIRLYCIVIFYLFKSLNLKGEISVNLCRDFNGRENDIKKTLKYFLEIGLKMNLNGRIYFGKLPQESNAHRYSFLMRHDNKNQMKTYIKLSLEDIEKWLLK